MKWLTRKQVLEKTGLGRTKLLELIKAKAFPQPHALPDVSGRIHENSTKLFIEEEVERWMISVVSSQKAPD